jgi:outer membrane protein assembly factor BamB
MTLLRIRPRTGATPRPALSTLRQAARLCALLAALAIPGAALFHAHATRADDPPAAGKLTMPLAVHWKFTGNYFGNNPAAPVFSEDTAYFASSNRVYAVSLRSGTLKWRYPSSAQDSLSSIVVTTPALSNGILYVASGSNLYALDAADGHLHWRSYLVAGGIYTSPVVIGDGIYFASGGGRIHAVNAKTGEALWQQGREVGQEAGGSVATEATVANGVMYYTTSNDILFAKDLASGVNKWFERVSGIDSNSQPALSGDTLMLLTGNILSNYRASTGQKRWFIQLPNNASVPPALDAEGNAYLITDNLQIYAVSGVRGRGLWKKPARIDFPPVTAPIVSGNMLIVPTSQGGIYVFDIETGALKWNYVIQPSATNINAIPTSVNIGSSPVVIGNTLYVLSDDGALTAFRPDAPDSLPPTITRLDPEQGEYLSGRAPFHISARIQDEGSGIDVSTLTLQLDNMKIPRRPPGVEVSDQDSFRYYPEDGTIDYATQAVAGKLDTLKDGHHTVTITVKDWMGNPLTKTWSFTVDDTIPRKTRKSTNPNPGSGNGPGGILGPGGGGGKGGG